jgi:signal transduction histidine kinase
MDRSTRHPEGTGNGRETATDLQGVAPFIIDQLRHGVIFVDRVGGIRMINREACRLLNADPEDVQGKRVDMLPIRAPLFKILGENSRGGGVEVSSGGLVLTVRSQRFTDPDGTELGILYEVRDITRERKERRQREEFVAMMTHDLKSPLTVVGGYLQSMAMALTDGEAVDRVMVCLHEAERACGKMLRMIENILDTYRLEVGLLKIQREYCDLNKLMADWGAGFQQEAQEQGVELIFAATADIPPLKLDEKQLWRVVANLVGNAVKFTPRGGRVSFAVRMEDDVLTFTVADTGIGIPARDLGKIFNKYFRAKGAIGFKGTGLGLAISKAIVEAHGGRIEVTSQEGEGSCFTVLIPATVTHEKKTQNITSNQAVMKGEYPWQTS